MARLIIIDDSLATRQLLEAIVESAGHVVVASCANGLEGAEQAEVWKPDLVLVDMLMPMIGGIEVVKRLRAQEQPPKIIMISSVSSTQTIKEAREAGISYYLLKPFDNAKVVELIDRCLAQVP